MEPYRSFKASIDYRLKTSIELCRLLQTKASIDFKWQSETLHLDWANEEDGVPSDVGYVCVRVQISKRTAQRQPHRLI